MRNNGPVTGKEQRFSADEKLISSTNLKGVIQHCNSAFEKISGFSYDELIGSAHNILRHPDMPQEAFKIMWEHLKAGRPWMGMIKNLCKNGDHYWVNAYVTPITEMGKVVGYESVRSCPSREEVERAEKLYTHINAKRPNIEIPYLTKLFLLILAAITPAFFLGFFGSTLLSSLWLGASLIAFSSFQYFKNLKDLTALKDELNNVFMHSLAVRTYTKHRGISGQIAVGIKSLRAHLDTVLTRIEDASEKVSEQSRLGLEHSEAARQEIAEQTKQTDSVAVAMNEMSKAVHEISHHVQDTASKAEQSNELALNGQSLAETTRKSIEQLRTTVINIGSSVQALVDQTQEISQAAGVIENISDKTNLLALNAAIEAARAGEHGRGFSIVADEVRSLAASTRHSAQEIGRIVTSLSEQANQSVKIAKTGAQDAEDGLKRVIESETMLHGISEALRQISSMSEQMAVAVEEQASVSQGINIQINEIAQLAVSSLNKTEESAKSIRRSQEVSNDLHELVSRFKQK